MFICELLRPTSFFLDCLELISQKCVDLGREWIPSAQFRPLERTFLNSRRIRSRSVLVRDQNGIRCHQYPVTAQYEGEKRTHDSPYGTSLVSR